MRDGRLSRRAFLGGSAAAGLAATSGLAPRRSGRPGEAGRHADLRQRGPAAQPRAPHAGARHLAALKPLVYENLVWIDHNLEPQAELAERWEQKSPTEYVFHLRPA